MLRVGAHLLVAAVTIGSQVAFADAAAEHARRLHFSSIVLDTHADTTQRFFTKGYDFARLNSDGSQVDLPRMRQGGLNALFLAVSLDPGVVGPAAVERALDQIDSIRQLVAEHSTALQLATSAADVRNAHSHGKIAILMGIEGGQMLGSDLRMIRIYSALGVRYMTLAHQRNNEWADSATDKPEHNGLTELGKQVIREMNRRGMLVDVSHASDRTFYDALDVSRAPLIASHSSVRAISNNARNMSDDMIRALAAKGGVVQIAYEQSFLSEEFRSAYTVAVGDLVANRAKARAECGDDDACLRSVRKREVDALQAGGTVPHVSWQKVVEHIGYVVRLVGVDHVGLGSDFDGASMPDGLEDCSKLPQITEALVRRGYSDRDIRKILGGNLLRVLEAAQRVAHRTGDT